MKARRDKITSVLNNKDEAVLTLSIFPRICTPGFTWPCFDPSHERGLSGSLHWPDQATCQAHDRYHHMTANITARRGRRPRVNVPVYQDVNTCQGCLEVLSEKGEDGSRQADQLPGHVFLDSSWATLGHCSLQLTIQGRDLEEARKIFDLLVPLAPIILALSAATPCLKGHLTATDCRWNCISQGKFNFKLFELIEVFN